MSSPDPRAEAELAAAFTRLHLGLAGADTDDAILRAVAHAVVAHGPHALRLYTLHDEGDGGPHATAELASVWLGGVCPAEDPLLGRPFAVAEHPVLARWFAAPDGAGDPRAADRGTVILPLPAGDAPGWLGVLTLTWPIEHITSPRERAVHELIRRTVASTLAARRALRRRQRALDEANTLHVAAAGLAEAGDLDEVLAALAEPAQAAGATWAALSACVRDDAGPRLVRVAPPASGEPPALAALAALFADAPAPCLYEQVDPDSLDVDVGAMVRLPLVIDGRPVGLLELGWPAPRSFPPELRNLYTALGEVAAAVVAGRAALAGLGVDVCAGGVIRFADGAPPDIDAPAAKLLAAHPEAEAALKAAIAGGARARSTIQAGDVTLELLVAPGPGPGEGVAVLQDISRERRAEAARLAARDALLAAQATQLARQAAPVLPLSPVAAAIPLLGALGGVHAAALREVALGLPVGVRALVVDLTGVTAVAPAAAEALAALTDAARAGDVDVVFTGVRPAFDLPDTLPVRRLGDALARALLAR